MNEENKVQPCLCAALCVAGGGKVCVRLSAVVSVIMPSGKRSMYVKQTAALSRENRYHLTNDH